MEGPAAEAVAPNALRANPGDNMNDTVDEGVDGDKVTAGAVASASRRGTLNDEQNAARKSDDVAAAYVRTTVAPPPPNTCDCIGNCNEMWREWTL